MEIIEKSKKLNWRKRRAEKKKADKLRKDAADWQTKSGTEFKLFNEYK